MILPFAGLEVLALILILRTNRKRKSKTDTYLDKLYVKLEENNRKITFDRFLSKFIVEENNSKKELFIKSNNQKIAIGSFLNQEEREQLIELLKKKVADLNFG